MVELKMKMVPDLLKDLEETTPDSETSVVGDGLMVASVLRCKKSRSHVKYGVRKKDTFSIRGDLSAIGFTSGVNTVMFEHEKMPKG